MGQSELGCLRNVEPVVPEETNLIAQEKVVEGSSSTEVGYSPRRETE